jgi:hypothetical protein
MKVEKKKVEKKSIDKLKGQKVDGKKVKGGVNIAGNEHLASFDLTGKKGIAGNERGGKNGATQGTKGTSVNPHIFPNPPSDL